MNEKGMEMAEAVGKALEGIKDPVVKVEKPTRTNRTILTYRHPEDKKAKKLKLYIREGVIMNPKVDEAIVKGLQAGELTAIRLRRTRDGVRVLERSVVEA